jgi:hypothetical protein
MENEEVRKRMDSGEIFHEIRKNTPLTPEENK